MSVSPPRSTAARTASAKPVVVRSAHTAEPRQGHTAPLNSVAMSGCQSGASTRPYRSRWSGCTTASVPGRAASGSAPSRATRTSSCRTAVPSQAARSPCVSAAIRRAASMVRSRPAAAKYTAEVAARMREPLPAARVLTRKCRAAARSHGSPFVSTSSVWRPMSLGCPAAHRWNRAKTSGSSRPPRSSRDSPTSTAICVSSVASPGSQPPPPHISSPRAVSCPAGPNSYGAPSASPAAEPTTAPTARSRRVVKASPQGIRRPALRGRTGRGRPGRPPPGWRERRTAGGGWRRAARG